MPFKKLSRLEFLYWILNYSTNHGNHLSIGQRILINQERALLIQDDYDLENHSYQLPEAINKKIDFIATKITQNNWQPKELDV